MTTRAEYWTNASVRALMQDKEGDPAHVITHKAIDLSLRAMQEGWTGPPFDPFALAQFLGLRVIPREDIADARTVPIGPHLTIEFNPNRAKARIRYSIYHEIAHTLFPDCRERVRNRLTHSTMKGDDWQLEMLCNLAAAEFAMPTGSMPSITDEHLDIDSVLALRKKYQVSAEAMLLRLVKMTDYQCTFFAASRATTPDSPQARYAIDFTKPSRTWPDASLRPRTELPNESVVSDCTAIGFTARGQEEWHQLGKVKIECVGVSPYPNQIFPRVIGFIKPHRQSGRSLPSIDYLKGDATQPRGTGHRFLLQIVNDQALTWGGGFSLVVRKKWPAVHDAFHAWVMNRENLKLGKLHVASAEENLLVLSMIAQHGYGPSPRPRIRYVALRKCLSAVGDLATESHATVHMPRIGCGQAGGSWDVVSELVTDALCNKGTKVFVYDPPGVEPPVQQQTTLRFLEPGSVERPTDPGGE